MQMCRHYHLILSVITLNIVNGQTISSDYKVPQPTAVVLSPKGFRITIPDERGIVLFAFHGNINKNIQINDVGDYYGQTRTKSKGLWSYENTQYQLHQDDVLNFWIYVQHNNFGYTLQNQRYVYPDHFVYDSKYTNFGGSSPLTERNDDRWTSPQNVPHRITMTTTTMSPSLPFVYEESNVYTQPQYTEYTTRTSRPITTSSTRRTTTRYTTRNTDSSNFWGTTTKRPTQQNQQNQYNQQNQQNEYNHNQQNPSNQQNEYHQQQFNQQNPPNEQNEYSYQQQHNQQNPSNQQNEYTYQQQHNQQNPSNQQNEYSHQQHNQQSSFNQEQNNQYCNPSITTVNKKHISCKDTLVFEEQFNQGFLRRWSQDVRMPLEFEDAEFCVYHKYSSVWNVSNGNLNIFPKLLYRVRESGFSQDDIRTGHFVIDSRECTSFVDPKQECERHAGLKRILPPVVSAKFRSKKTFNFKYGKVEIRAKLPKGDWIFPEIYLEPTENRYRGPQDLAYLNGQIRIAFIHGNDVLEKSDGIPLDGKILIGICVISSGDTVREVARKSIHFGQEHFGNDFHTYSIIWTNSSIRFLVDGLEYGTDTGGYKNLQSIPNAIHWESGTNMAPFDQEFHISLGVGVGGNGDFPEDSRTGSLKIPKPWENTSPKAELSFFMSVDEWHPTWTESSSGLKIDYVKVYSV